MYFVARKCILDVKIIFFNALKNIYLFKIYFQNIYIYVHFEKKNLQIYLWLFFIYFKIYKKIHLKKMSWQKISADIFLSGPGIEPGSPVP